MSVLKYTKFDMINSIIVYFINSYSDQFDADL